MCVDIKKHYLHTLLHQYEYIRIPLSAFPEHTIQQYNLHEKSNNGYVYVEIQQYIYGIPQAVTPANKGLKENLYPHGYFEFTHTPGLWKHIT